MSFSYLLHIPGYSLVIQVSAVFVFYLSEIFLRIIIVFIIGILFHCRRVLCFWFYVDLLNLLCELVPQLSAHDQDKLFKLVLKPDVIIVMANHAAIQVRIAVIQVFMKTHVL